MLKKHPLVLIVDDEKDIVNLFSDYLMEFDYILEKAFSAKEARVSLDKATFDCIFLDINMPQESGYILLNHIKKVSPETAVIMVSGIQEIDMVVKCMHAGAYDYIVKPLRDINQLKIRLDHALEEQNLRRQNKILKTELAHHIDIPEMRTNSPSMKQVVEQIATVAPFNTTILISGESGTGKEIVAQSIHQLSNRTDFPFIPVNCGAISPTLLASTLFGHEKGAFTDAHKQQIGLFEESDGGTILLDEVTETDLEFQTQLLRVLEQRQIRRVGGNRDIQLNLRILAATNQDILQLVKEKKFREDLYYRLNVVQIQIPPLRERMEDLPLLVDYHLKKLTRKMKTKSLKIQPDAMKALNAYEWPGNIRELSNILENSALMCKNSTIQQSDLSSSIIDNETAVNATVADGPSYDAAKMEFEFSFFTSLIKSTGGNMSKAAREAGLSRQHLYLKMKQLNITPSVS